MRPRLPALALLATLAALAGCAHDDTMTADTRDFVTMEPVDVTPPDRITRYADADRDGNVTREEARADPALAAGFDRYDLDGNGRLDRGEFARLEDMRRQRAATTASAGQVSRRWMVEKPGGYFGPERHESLNRTGGEQGWPQGTE